MTGTEGEADVTTMIGWAQKYLIPNDIVTQLKKDGFRLDDLSKYSSDDLQFSLTLYTSKYKYTFCTSDFNGSVRI